MKDYERPLMAVLNLQHKEHVASLNDWLNTNGLTEAGITNYIINS